MVKKVKISLWTHLNHQKWPYKNPSKKSQTLNLFWQDLNQKTSPAVYQKDQTETTYTYEKTDLFHVLDFLFSEI